MHRCLPIAAGVLALMTSACERSTPGHDTAAAVQAAAAPTAANVVTIVAHEYALQLPDTIPAGLTTFRLRNDGKQTHEAALVRLDDGKTGADVIAGSKTPGPDASWAHWVGGPAAAIPGGGQQPSVTVVLAPGHYAVLCGVPGPDGRPHWLSGMFKDFTVSPSATAAAAPTSDAAVTLVDYDFQFATPMTAGTHTVRVTNSGMQDHHMIIFRLAPGKSMADLLTWLNSETGPPPMVWASGAGALSPGTVAYLNADFPPGEYVLLCFLPDTRDGKPHIAHGMRKQFTVM
jgi:uncharacterized cupredoxin-like copper-binding protein